MLSFEVKSDGLQIYCDEKGMETLIKALERLKVDGDHIHLYSQAFLGQEIDSRTPADHPAIDMVTITWFGE